MQAESKPVDLDALLDESEAVPDGVRARVLRAAVREFSRVGLDAARTHAIAHEAGVASGSLHFHWRDKKTLFEAACLWASRRYTATLSAAFSRATPSDPAAMARHFVEAMAKLLAEEPCIPQLLLHRFTKQTELLPSDRHVADMKMTEEMLRSLYPNAKIDIQLLILTVYFGTLTMFYEPLVQTEYLGQSTKDAAFVARYRDFMTMLLARCLA